MAFRRRYSSRRRRGSFRPRRRGRSSVRGIRAGYRMG